MKSLQSEIALLPTEQFNWLITIKKKIKPAVHYGTMEVKDLINAFKSRANEKHYLDIVALINIYDFEEYFKK